MKEFRIPKNIKKFSEIFHKNGFDVYIVGGAVRDFFIGKPIKDYDFTTNATPEQVMALFPRTFPTGIDHGTVTVVIDNHHFEVTTFRAESSYSNSRHPDSVEYITSLEEDLKRRDFTINAMAVDTRTGQVYDHHNGMSDIEHGIIRCIGNPMERFSEDALRILRAYRISAVIGFSIDLDTALAASKLAHTIERVSFERIQEEFNKILTVTKPSLTLHALQKAGILTYIIPELTDCIGVGEKGSQGFDTFHHLCRCCDGAPSENPIVRIAALLHDIGKPACEKKLVDGKTIFYGHDEKSAEMASILLRRLKYSNKTINIVSHLIRHHMFNYSDEWTDAAVRRFISRVGKENIMDLISLRMADNYGSSDISLKSFHRIPPVNLINLIKRVEAVLENESVLKIRDLAIDGNDLIEAGFTRGPEIGTVLGLLLEAVLEDPDQNSRGTLLEMAVNMRRNYHIDLGQG